MATFDQSPEEGRPPESPPHSQMYTAPPLTSRHPWNKVFTYTPTSDNYPSTDTLNNNNELLIDVNKNNKNSLKQLLCIKKPSSLTTLNVSTLSLNKNNNNNYCKFEEDGAPSTLQRQKHRNSFHQNVEEALSSLLWQPYEYQNKQQKKRCNSSSSVSSNSNSSSSISSLDLDETPNNSPTIQADLYLPHHTEMVNNLTGKRRCDDQSLRRTDARDARQGLATSRLRFGVSCTREDDDDDATTCFLHGDPGAAMQVEVNNGSGAASSSSSASSINININSGTTTALRAAPPDNLSSANVVGLPSHVRYASVPASNRTTGSSTISNQFIRYSSGNNTTPISNRPMNIDQQHPQHFRSSSVPSKCNLKVVPPSPPQQQGNVSNVNVNFYRAVPVNVVSSVPTIQCLNTLTSDAGNNVSNVQIMPLGTTTTPTHYPVLTTEVTVHNAIQPTHSIQIPNTNYRPPVPSSLQIPLNLQRNTVVPISNSIQIPASYSTRSTNTPCSVQITPPRNTQVVPIQSNRVSTTTNRTNSQITIQNRGTLQGEVSTTRTFTSTEAQTDDITTTNPNNNEVPSSANREQRRRDRRERRHQRRLNNVNHRHTGTQANEALPDLLNSHLPPPYSTLPNGGTSNANVMLPTPCVVPHHPSSAVLQTVVPNSVVPSGFAFPPPPVTVVPGQVPLVQGATPVAVPVAAPTGFRFPFPATTFRRGRFSEEPPKSCCGLLSWKPGSLRWFIALIALVAVCCVLVGTALGAMRPAGRDHLTVSLLMIGVGVVLVTVSGVAWRLTSHDSSTCRSMLGLGSTESVDVCARRFVPRLPPSYGRPHHPYAAMMYPEFQYRPPPPSYQASMQEYRLRLLLLDRGNSPQIQSGIQNAVSPPPTYRSHAGSLLRVPLSNRRDATVSEYSCPPSYRSQNSSNRHGTLPNPNSVLHSREHSLSLSESNTVIEPTVNVVNILGSADDDIALDSLKMEPENDMNALRMLLKGSSSDLEGSKDGNLVTIVQTSDQSPVIVTVSGSSHIDANHSVQITEIPSEMEILAHL